MQKNEQISLIWDKIEPDQSVERPTAREGHVMVHLPDKNSYLLFGGVSHTRYSDVFIFSVDTRKWKSVKPTGDIPKELSHCVGWYDNPYFFFHGGRNKELSLSDTYFLDTTDWVWRKVFTMEQPPARYYHAVAKTENKEAYIFGGYDEKRNRCLGDLHRYEYKALKFSNNILDKVGGSSWINVTDSGTKPPARKGHTMLFYKGFIILYGGMTNKGLDDGNIYKYNIETRQWMIVTVTGTQPGARVFHSMCFFKPDHLVIFGGKLKQEKEAQITQNSQQNTQNFNSSNNSISPILTSNSETGMYYFISLFLGKTTRGSKTKDGSLINSSKSVEIPQLSDNYIITNEYVFIDLIELNSYKPFIGNIYPSARFGHTGCFNSNFSPEFECLITGGLDQTYLPMDVYIIKEQSMGSEKKWVYEQKKMHSSQVESKDVIFEIAKKTIISYKKQLEVLTTRNFEVNRKFAEQFNTLNTYKKNLLEEDLSTNEKKTKQIQKSNQIESEKRTLLNEATELKEYNNLLNTQLKINREKFLLLSEFLESSIEDVRMMDEILCTVDKSPEKIQLFSNIDLDSICFKRKNYKTDLEEYKVFLKDSSLFEKEIYEQIVKNQEDQKEKFKNEYYIGNEDKQILSFRERDVLNDSLENK